MSLDLLRAIVIEDEWPARNYLIELLEASNLARVVGATGTAGDAELLLQRATAEEWIDVAFVDIQLTGSADPDAGLGLIRNRAGASRTPWFVITTAHAQHAAEAFDLGVVDYLRKPFTAARVNACLERLRLQRAALANYAERTRPAASRRIAARRGRDVVFLAPGEVWAFEAQERLTFVHTVHGRFDLDWSLAAIESGAGPSLLRVHRSWLVNLEHVKAISGRGAETELLVGDGVLGGETGLRVPVARDRSAAVRNLLLAPTTGLRGANQ